MENDGGGRDERVSVFGWYWHDGPKGSGMIWNGDLHLRFEMSNFGIRTSEKDFRPAYAYADMAHLQAARRLQIPNPNSHRPE